MSRRALLWIVLGALLVLSFAWLASHLERVPDREFVGLSGAARARPFLAAQRFAARMGRHAQEMRALPELDALPPEGVLLLPNRRQVFTPARIAQLARWVEAGGHLIVEAEYMGVADPLLDRFGVKRLADPFPGGTKPRPVEITGEGTKLSALLWAPMKLEVPKSTVVLRGGLPSGTKLVSFTRGDGIVTAVVTLNFARNAAIGERDHGELLWRLLQLTDADEFRVLFSLEKLSLWTFLTENAWTALIPAAMLLLLWLWRIAPRFGPIAPDPPSGRRRLLDHLRASGRYYWSHGLRRELISAARDAALRRLSRAQPDFAFTSGTEQVARLAAFAGLSREEAGALLIAHDTPRASDFVVLMHHAQRVHAAAERGEPAIH
jgi:hypothetical protein